jgi:[ribosomal protein S5]-alanine N-acetyltransferase
VDDKIALRAFTPADLDFLDRWAIDPEAMGEFEWIGFRDAARKRRRFEKDGYISNEHASIAVALPDGTCVGVASYWPKHHGGPEGGCMEIGIGFVPEFRRRGFGTTTTRLLADYLFNYTSVHRIEALTDDENLATQKILERSGFEREGLLRGAYFHRGAWRNLLVYAIVRGDPRDR